MIGCFGLTEPDFGSNPAGMRTFARRDGSDWVLDGTKMWITNGSIADLAIVWAQTDAGIRGFMRAARHARFSRQRHPSQAFTARVDHERAGALGLPPSRRRALAAGEGLGAPLACLNEARYGIVWGAMGAARACYETALEYSKTRVQFDRPIGGFQITQQKLVDMLLELNKGTLLALHLGRMKDEGRLHPAQVELRKTQQRARSAGDCAGSAHDPRRQRRDARISGDPAHE